jgi:ABC-type glycerol-3-phosphate transport system substrate-binding protein
MMNIGSCGKYFLCLFVLTFVMAETARTADVGSSAPGEWEKIVAKAEEEGQVIVYASDSVGNLRLIWEAFQKQYPKIKLTGTSVGRGSDLLPKIFAERRAGKFLPDIFLGAPSAIYLNLYRAKIIEPLPPVLMQPGVADRSKWWMGKHHYIDPEGQYIFMYESVIYGPPLYYNTKLINEKEIKSAWDLVQPKWKGKYEALQIGFRPRLDGAHLRLLPSSARSEIHRTGVPRHGADGFP